MADIQEAVSRFGVAAKATLANPAVTGEPEDRLRTPLVNLCRELAELCGFKLESIACVGEAPLSTLKTRPDYAITLRKTLLGTLSCESGMCFPVQISPRVSGAK